MHILQSTKRGQKKSKLEGGASELEISENAENSDSDKRNILPERRNQFPLSLTSSPDTKVFFQLCNFVHSNWH